MAAGPEHACMHSSQQRSRLTWQRAMLPTPLTDNATTPIAPATAALLWTDTAAALPHACTHAAPDSARSFLRTLHPKLIPCRPHHHARGLLASGQAPRGLDPQSLQPWYLCLRRL